MAHFKKGDYLTSEERGSSKPRPDTSQQEPPNPDADRHWATTDGGTVTGVWLLEHSVQKELVQRAPMPAEPPHPCFRKPGDGPGDAALDLEGARAKISGNKYLEHVLPDKI